MHTLQSLVRKSFVLGVAVTFVLTYAPASAQTPAPTAQANSTMVASVTPRPRTATVVPSRTRTATRRPSLTPRPSATPAAAQSDSAIFTTAGAFFALSVQDMDATTKWYSDKLGLEIVVQPPASNGIGVTVLEGGGLIVELVQNEKAVPLSEAAPEMQDPLLIHGIFKVGLVVDDLEATLAELQVRDVPIAFGPFAAGTNQKANLIIRDNEGNLIQFFGK